MLGNSKPMECISKFLKNTDADQIESELYHSKHYCEMKIRRV